MPARGDDWLTSFDSPYTGALVLVKQSLTLGSLAVCSAALAVLVPLYVATRLGVGVETDAFFASAAMPQLVFLVMSTSLAYVLVPLLAASEDGPTFRNDAWVFFLGITLLFSLIGIILFITARYWVLVLVPGFTPAGKALALRLTKIQLISMVFNASIVVLWSISQARLRFIWVELSAVVANVLSLFFLFWSFPRYGVAAAPWTIVLNNGLKIAFLTPILGRWHWPRWRPLVMRETWRRIRPFLFAAPYYRADPLVDRFLTSMAGAGGLSLVYMGQQIFASANQIINRAISVPMVPLLAIEAKAGRYRNYRGIYHKRLRSMAALTGLGCLLLLAIGRPVLHLAIGHGGVTVENVRTLWWIMMALAGVFVGIIAFLHYGIIGLALTSSLYCLASFMIQWIVLEKMTSPARLSAHPAQL